jgi:lysophospholipase L1-like esterase
MPISELVRGRSLRTAVAAATATTLSMAAVACGGPDPDTPEARGATGSGRPSPSPSPTPGWDRTPDSIAALGDSITIGFDTCSLPTDCPEASWATGTDTAVNSLSRRLLPNPAGRTWNHAASGAVMADLPGQARKAVAHQPDMVTVLIGANDACSADPGGMTPTERFRAEFTEAVRTLRAGLPKTQVFVASVPDLKRLWSEGRKNSSAVQAWELGVCQSMLKDPRATDAPATKRREQVSDRVAEYNTVLEEVCAADLRCRYDDGAVHDYRFSTDELSQWDWFHPNKRGQRILAGLAYKFVTA